ncbi:MAG TPA: thioesterase family protein [Bryobacteraceae bacterium]|nr:thioesterase family protein [Bryobacteraceae bacterium]
MPDIKIGTRGEERLLVTSEVSIDFLDLPNARVLSTPQMIRYMEWTSRNTVLPFLESGYDTVGTKVNIHHLAAAPIGSVVTFTSEILSVEDRRVLFQVAAKTGSEMIGEGTHERAIINKAKFATRLAEKSRRD